MANSRYVFTPASGNLGASAHPELTNIVVAGDSTPRMALAFDDSTDQAVYWEFVAPQGLTGTLALTLHYFMASASSGNVVWQARVEAVTAGDTLDMDASSSFDSANSQTDAVPGTQGDKGEATITLTNADSITAGDYVRLEIIRDADNGSDTASGDAYLLLVELQDDV